MTGPIVVDTGPLVAAFDKRDALAGRTAEALKTIRGPMLTCEPVLAETWFLLSHLPTAWEKVVKWIDRGILQIGFDLESNRDSVFPMMAKYRDQPMSLADACLVAMADANPGSRIFTFDHHFQIYRPKSRRKIRTLGLESL